MENKKRLAIEDFKSENKLQIIKELAFNMQSKSNEKKSFLKEAKDIVDKAKIKVLYTEIELTWEDDVNTSELTESEKKMIESSKNKITPYECVEIENKELNLCELLKDCIGVEFYMPHYGNVKLKHIDRDMNLVFHNGVIEIGITKKGISGGYSRGELCVFPSKEQRDWSLFQPPWIPQKGERVWAKNSGGDWRGCYFIEMSDDATHKYRCTQKIKDDRVPGIYINCIPFDQIPW